MRSLNARQEAFCREYLKGNGGAMAAVRAGYMPRSCHVRASRLLSNPRVRARIKELRDDVAFRSCQDASTLLSKLEEVYERAMRMGEYGSAQRAVALQARIGGFDKGPEGQGAKKG